MNRVIRDNNAEKDPKRGMIPVLAILALVGMIIIASFLYQPQPVSRQTDNLSDSISFPKDEGLHEELGEGWQFHLNFKTENGNSYYLTTTYYYSNHIGGTPDVTSGRKVLFLNTKTYKAYNGKLEAGSTISGAKGYGAVLFKYTNNKTGINFSDWWDRENGSFIYKYHTEIYNNTQKVLEANITILDTIGEPILLTETGVIKIPQKATYRGYFQPRLKLSGEITVDGQKLQIEEGDGYLTHMWGATPSIVEDQFLINVPTGHTIIVANYYYPVNQTTALGAVVIVNPNNTYEISDSPIINISAQKYISAPYDITHTLAWAYQWKLRVSGQNNINMTISAVYDKQFPYHSWDGFCYANGSFDGKNYASSAFSEATKHYMSFIHITHHQLNLNPEIPTDNMTISCQVNHTLPIKTVIMKYNTSRDKNWTSLELMNNSEYHTFNGEEYSDIWEGTVPGQPLFTTIYYYIEVTDITGHIERTAMGSQKIQIEYPD